MSAYRAGHVCLSTFFNSATSEGHPRSLILENVAKEKGKKQEGKKERKN
jgi:hypothetical protein